MLCVGSMRSIEFVKEKPRIAIFQSVNKCNKFKVVGFIT